MQSRWPLTHCLCPLTNPCPYLCLSPLRTFVSVLTGARDLKQFVRVRTVGGLDGYGRGRRRGYNNFGGYNTFGGGYNRGFNNYGNRGFGNRGSGFAVGVGLG